MAASPYEDSTLSPLDGGDFLELAQTLNVGVAVVGIAEWDILFENASFYMWFPPGSGIDTPLPSRVPGLDVERASSRLSGGGAHSFETEVKSGARTVSVAVEIRPLGEAATGQAVVECQDISRQKQIEYMLESYSQLAEKNARDVQREKDRVERLLLNIMPKSVYEEMKDIGTVTPQLFDQATVLVLDFVGSSGIAVSRGPGTLVTELNDIFAVFDRIADMYGVERIRTVGDAYMAVSGLPIQTPDHAHNVARMALRMVRYVERRNSAHPEEWQCRIGISTGPVIGSLVGIQKYVYDIFGPGVNLAARMGSLSGPMKITISEETFRLINDDFLCVDRGDYELQGFDTQRLYFLEREIARAL